MRILSISAQKPHSTGSGVYLTSLINGFARLGARQAVCAGVYEDDIVNLPEGVDFYPVYFNTQDLPFAIPGMSDEMPYESTVYGQMSSEMVAQFRTGAIDRIKQAVEEFTPDVILCHHLYLLTAWVREEFSNHKVVGICHNTDLRQMTKIPLEREYIRGQIRKLDQVFALHEEMKERICHTYGYPKEQICVVGVGYNNKIFYREAKSREDDTIRLIFAGKLAEKKGVMSLLRSLEHLPYRENQVVLQLAGGYSNQKEYDEICNLIKDAKYPVELLGRLSQEELAEAFRENDVFVLPSFYEGLPLVVIEAMACGLQVVCTDIPGVRPWLDQNIEQHGVEFVDLPVIQNADEVLPESLPEFERKLAVGIQHIAEQKNKEVQVTHLSWDGISQTIYTSCTSCNRAYNQ